MRGKDHQTQEVKLGRPPSERAPSKKDLIRFYTREGKSIREVAEALDCSKDMVARALKGHGIQTRTKIRKSALKKYEPRALAVLVREKGVRGAAREIGVNPSTLSRFLKQKTKK